jgi:hypothetical protein
VLSRGDSDARGHAHAGLLVGSELERGLQRFQQPLGDQLRSRLQRELLGDHDELIAPETAERVGRAHHAIQARRDRS